VNEYQIILYKTGTTWHSSVKDGGEAIGGASPDPQCPCRPWLAPLLLPICRRLASRKSEYGDEKALGPRWLWLHVYRYGYRSYGTGVWYEDWHALVGWRDGHRSFYLFDAKESV